MFFRKKKNWSIVFENVPPLLKTNQKGDMFFRKKSGWRVFFGKVPFLKTKCIKKFGDLKIEVQHAKDDSVYSIYTDGHKTYIQLNSNDLNTVLEFCDIRFGGTPQES